MDPHLSGHHGVCVIYSLKPLVCCLDIEFIRVPSSVFVGSKAMTVFLQPCSPCDRLTAV